jgi:hypothetical protein
MERAVESNAKPFGTTWCLNEVVRYDSQTRKLTIEQTDIQEDWYYRLVKQLHYSYYDNILYSDHKAYANEICKALSEQLYSIPNDSPMLNNLTLMSHITSFVNALVIQDHPDAGLFRWTRENIGHDVQG